MTPELSIIIPCYNGEKFIESSINKVLSINLNKEIIVVNDGSTDNSLKLLKKYGDKIVLIDVKKNEGVSHARNLGIAAAKGKFLTFIDIDDDFELDMHSKMIAKMIRESSDLCICDNDSRLENGRKVRRKYQMQSSCLTQDAIIKLFLTDKICPAVWSSVYKTEIAKRLAFNESLKIGEDVLFPLQYYILTNSASILNEPLYHYILRQSSTMHILSDTLLDYLKIESLLSKKDLLFLEEKYQEEFNYFKLEMMIRSLHAISFISTKQRKNALNLIKKISFKREDINNIIKNHFTPKYVKFEFLIIKLFGFSFHLFIFPIYKFMRQLIRKS